MFGVVGLDPSLRCSAAVELDDAGAVRACLVFTPSKRDVQAFHNDARTRVLESHTVHVGDDAGSWSRIEEVAEALTRFVWLSSADVVGIEEHAPGGAGSMTKSAPRLHHLSGIVRHELFKGGAGAAVEGAYTGIVYRERPVPFLCIEPNVVKSFATGKGNAEKPAMVAAARAAGFWQLDKLCKDSAEGLADAYWIARMTQTWLLVKRGRLPSARCSPVVRRILEPREGRPGLLARPLMQR